ncbi:hypothetical protein [Chryseobacterium sp. RU33C]|uniref:hypothetical protein n=1 Tax=Chryseobacterium sp. RU33C TaxID=1907398 RepID=UPI000954170A|nr:hypothetical protein [Chryseobacterium sp. RU33C]SIP92666.1 hypothetical protein SAMN05880573_101160 [Chryseobacterium sp. RU33C]
MRKTLFPLIACFSYIAISGQVGINTASPKSTLEITAKNAVGTSTGTDGLLIPRLDRQRALSMTTASIQPSTLIYIDDASTGTATGQASNINTTGFYYFDGSTTKWTKLITSGDVPNITTSNGLTKTGNDVKLGGTLTENTVINGTSVINIPQTNGIAIGSTGQVAGAKLLVQGGALQVGGQMANYAGGLLVRNQDALKPVATMYNTSNSELFRLNENGNVGFGTNSPSQKIDVDGNVRFRGVPNSSTTTDTDRIMVLDSDGTAKKFTIASLQPTASNGLTKTGNDVKLGGPLTENTIVSGLTNANKMQFAGTGIDVLNVDGTTFSVDATNDRIGIGTAAPTQKLDVNGIARIAEKLTIGSTFTGSAFSVRNTNSTEPIATFTASEGTRVVHIGEDGKMGIGTNTPVAKVHIENSSTQPSLIVKGLANQPESSNSAFLTIDNTTGQVFKGSQSEKVFYYQTYELTNVAGDFVSNYNTMIPSADYTLVIVGSVFDQPLTTLTTPVRFTSQNVYAFISNGTWRLSADFPNVTANNGTGTVNGTWKINTLIIRNNQVVTNSPVNQNLAGSSSGTAATAPVPVP